VQHGIDAATAKQIMALLKQLNLEDAQVSFVTGRIIVKTSVEDNLQLVTNKLSKQPLVIPLQFENVRGLDKSRIYSLDDMYGFYHKA
jgi:uncharacterized protein YajQ (UPF0234 family)